MVYVLEPEVFDHFPERDEVDWALDVFPAMLEHDVPFGVYVTDAYWNDVGSLPEYLQGNLDALTGAVDVEPAGELVDADAGATLGDSIEQSGRVLVGDGARVEAGARLDGPVVLGQGAVVGAGARVRETVLLPGAEVPAGGILAGAIAGAVGDLTG
jgi:NDP-sugar pyrophosphorylase family protein